MSENDTKSYRRSVAGSVGSGMKSIIGGEKRFYTLVHKISSQYHKAGESQPIIVDEIEIGRDSKCQVRFDESFSTVSRRHAAIVRDGDNWKLVQLSQTNSTYLNGHKVEKEWYLQNGDEIQLSTNGPKLGFIIPDGKAGTVGSLGLTSRLNLFRQQALRPYKTAIWAVAALLLFVCIGGGILLSRTNNELKNEANARIEAEANWLAEKEKMQEAMNEMAKQNADISSLLEKTKQDMSQMKKDMAKRKPSVAPVQKGSSEGGMFTNCFPNIYYIQVIGFDYSFEGESGYISCEEEDVPSWSGTAFLLSDGRFVTARHVIEAWNYSADDELLMALNIIANNGKLNAHFVCASSSGDYYECTSDMFVFDNSRDMSAITENNYKISQASPEDTDGDYAYVKTDLKGGLQFSDSKSQTLAMGEKLTVLGFPYGIGASNSGITPIYGSAISASDGLVDGVILTTDTNYEHGNSGGPAFALDSNGAPVVVGLISSGLGRNLGFIIPISAVK